MERYHFIYYTFYYSFILDLMFDSPSAFSIYVKRTVNPTRKADDGWKSIKYQGKYLDYYKLQLAKKRSEQNKVTTPPTMNQELQKVNNIIK